MPKARLVFDGDWVYTEKEIRIHKLTQETENKIDNIPGVVDNANSESTTDALSAHMGKVLQDQINNLSGANTYLSNWDCTTGLPETEPQVDPYRYKAWNYYIVSVVASSWWTNYKPHWNQYIHWVASSTVETWDISVNDWYIYDGSQWLIQPAWNREIVIDDALSSTSRNAVENRAVYSALTQKQNNILDLNTIREGAAAWATALQALDNITELTNNAGYQTAGDVNSAITTAIQTLAPEWVWTWVLTLQKNATTIDTFSANAIQNKTINITVPTTVAELTDASDYVTDTELSTTLDDYATKSYVDWSVIHTWSTAPANPTEGMLWYDTTNNVLKSYNWTSWDVVWDDSPNVNTKTFYLSSTSDLTNAQAAYDWYAANKNPIVVLWTGYVVNSTWVGFIDFKPINIIIDTSDPDYIEIEYPVLRFTIVNNEVTQVQLINLSTRFVSQQYVDDWLSTKQATLVSWTNIKTVNSHSLLWDWNIDIIWVEEIQFVTQAEYDALPSSKLSDWKAYFIYSWHGAAIVSDEPYWSTWDWITTQAPSKNVIYDVLGDIETLLATL